jgi:hypothetical protein
MRIVSTGVQTSPMGPEPIVIQSESRKPSLAACRTVAIAMLPLPA